MPEIWTSISIAQPTNLKVFLVVLSITDDDEFNHVVIADYPCFSQGGPSPAQTQLAAYTVGEDGNLTTTDTYATMPAAAIITPVNAKLAISPSDKFLAVADFGGLQIYHFNGANPITTFTSLLTTDNISVIAWDKNDQCTQRQFFGLLAAAGLQPQ